VLLCRYGIYKWYLYNVQGGSVCLLWAELSEKMQGNKNSCIDHLQLVFAMQKTTTPKPMGLLS
jgi:hypothetical protein